MKKKRKFNNWKLPSANSDNKPQIPKQHNKDSKKKLRFGRKNKSKKQKKKNFITDKPWKPRGKTNF